jgi:hypothetical protein
MSYLIELRGKATRLFFLAYNLFVAFFPAILLDTVLFLVKILLYSRQPRLDMAHERETGFPP